MRVVDEHIRQAMEAGDFDNLPGAGKPLKLDENPFTDPEWRLAYRTLQNSGFSLPWIETRREIERELHEARRALRRSVAWRDRRQELDLPVEIVQDEWTRALAAFKEKIEKLNKRILDYNLEAPSGWFQMRTINIERELELTTTSPSDTLSV